MILRAFSICLCLGLLVQSCSSSEPKFRKDGYLEFLNAEDLSPISEIELEMADSYQERQQGLMYRKSMKENQGMIFMFSQETTQSFWMKNTYISLDIIYVDGELKIVSIAKNTVPESEEQIPSKGPAQYVVEVIAGYTDKFGIEAGDYIRTRAK
jgi:uncharacterized membrane protein (UPF0127 family)